MCDKFCFMKQSLNSQVESWYKASPRRAVSFKLLQNQFQKETGNNISYNHFRLQSQKVTKVQNIKTGGYFVRMPDFINMTVTRAFNQIGFANTICIDEKTFVPRKYTVKNLRVHKSFKGKGTAKFVNAPDPLRYINPVFLLCAISNCTVVLSHISDQPIDSEIFNSFIWKLCDQFPENNENLYFLCDNASFHGISHITQKHLNNNNIFITRTTPLGCFTNPIEEFFSIVHSKFEEILGQRMLSNDSYLSKEEYLNIIKHSIVYASETCNYKIIFARSGLL